MGNGREVILLVEGNAEILRVETNILEEKHCEVIAMEDGKQALDYLKENPYDTDLVLAAIDAPVIDGKELLRLLKLSQRMKDIPVVIKLPVDREEDRTEVMNNGAEDILLTPYDERCMFRRISNIIMASRRPFCINIMEEAVVRELDRHIDELGMCKCRQCRKDVQTLALNRVKPKYISSERGRVLSGLDQLSSDYLPDILCALTESAEIVKKNPRHT